MGECPERTMGLALNPAFDRCPRWEWRRARLPWRVRPSGGRGSGQRDPGSARKLEARLARTEGVEAEILSGPLLAHLRRAPSTLHPLPRQPSFAVLWTVALEVVTSSPLAHVHSAF